MSSDNTLSGFEGDKTQQLKSADPGETKPLGIPLVDSPTLRSAMFMRKNSESCQSFRTETTGSESGMSVDMNLLEPTEGRRKKMRVRFTGKHHNNG